MSLRHLRRSRRETVDMEFEIAPLVDMVFLLLLFFVVSTTFRGQPGVKVDLPRAASASVEIPDFTEIVITKEGNIYLSGKQVPDLFKLGTMLEKESDISESKIAYVRADRNTRHGMVVAVIDVARRAGFLEATVATAPVLVNE